MKRRTRGLIAAAYAAAFLAVGLALAMSASASADRGHLLWDPRDQVWRCLGSPLDCVFVEE